MEINLSIAFIFGILSFFSPCILPLVPGFFSIISSNKVQSPRTRVVGTVFFVTGFSIVFVSLASVATSIGSILLNNVSSYRLIAGFVIITFGVTLIFPQFQFLYFINKELKYDQIANLNFKNFLLGVSFAFGFTPCIGPVLGSLLTLASNTDTIGEGVYLLLWYSFGMGVPFILSSILYNTFSFKNRLFNLLSRYSNYISGLTLISIGTLIAIDKMYILSAFIQDIFFLLGLEFLTTI
tara:strand:- start:93 stop:806 length:714 start_codon:yes stop_codon:yes gene_type:complete